MPRTSQRLRSGAAGGLRRLLTALVAAGLVAPAAAGASVGPTVAGSTADWIPAGEAQSYRVTSNATEQVDTLSVFVDASSSLSASSRFELGLYGGSATSAGTRLARCVITTVVAD